MSTIRIEISEADGERYVQLSADGASLEGNEPGRYAIVPDSPATVNAPDAFVIRSLAERIVGEDRVPMNDLLALIRDFGDDDARAAVFGPERHTPPAR